MMFSTFSVNLETADGTREKPATPTAPRPKRSQVARACDWCRLNRIKCDDKQPCQNCENRGVNCSNTKPQEATSLPAANREIQRLRNKVKELQQQIRNLKDDAESSRRSSDAMLTGYATPPLSEASPATTPSDYSLENTKAGWQGIQQTGLYYGPMSSSYFVSRITRYLAQTSSRPRADTMARFDFTPPSHRPSLDASPASQGSDTGPDDVEDLTRTQEESFLALLWQTFHCVHPVLSEGDFRQYYDSLWADGTATRRPSALVDVLLAVCMQYGSTFLFDEQPGSDTQGQGEYANLAVHAYYQRAQTLLQSGLEHPTIQLLQGYIYSVIYLYNAALLNAAHITLGVAVRIGHALRLHLPAPAGTASLEDQELHRRIWWTIYDLDGQLSLALGRPPLIQLSQVSCGLPRDDCQPTAGTSSMALPPTQADISWLSFHVQSTKLIFAVQGLQTAFQSTCMQLLSRDGDIYDDPRTTEMLATAMSRELSAARQWVQNVPTSLRIARKGGAEPFSTDRVPLNLDLYSPLWLQRQRVLLELLYHHLQISTLRPFLRFPPVASSLTPQADSHAIACLNHAMAITSILNQVLFDTDLLHGWLPVFQYQWDATVCTLGFVLANPVCPPTPAARKSLPSAIRILRLIGDHFPAAANAAQVVHEVSCCATQLIETVRNSFGRRAGGAGGSQRASQSASPLMLQNPSPPLTQTPASSVTSPSPLGSTVPLMADTAPHHQPLIQGLDLTGTHGLPFFDLLTGGGLTGLSPALTGESPIPGVSPLPGVSAADLIAASEGAWLDSNAMILDTWAEFTPPDTL